MKIGAPSVLKPSLLLPSTAAPQLSSSEKRPLRPPIRSYPPLPNSEPSGPSVRPRACAKAGAAGARKATLMASASSKSLDFIESPRVRCDSSANGDATQFAYIQLPRPFRATFLGIRTRPPHPRRASEVVNSTLHPRPREPLGMLAQEDQQALAHPIRIGWVIDS